MVKTPKGRVYVKFCTKPTSCEFNLKSVTYSQMAKSRAEHLSPPKKGRRLADSQLTDLEIWDTLLVGVGNIVISRATCRNYLLIVLWTHIIMGPQTLFGNAYSYIHLSM
jgi:hypothetical protein